jgi:protein-L-isoaspartate O-methyltransferase
MNEHIGTASYSPDDNKIRINPHARLAPDIYNRLKSAGFKWAPKQELFVAPMWTPDREDLAIELCGEIGDDDQSLIERSEQRADRFEDYSTKRAAEARQAHAAVESICEHIPLGQPILVGHHSERHARRDAERIENGMRRAIKAFETSKYWEDRAASAIAHAKYKERPDVRARRIKAIEADRRRQERSKAAAEQGLRFWRGEFNLVNKTTGAKRPLEITEANKATILYVIGRDSNLGHLPVIRQTTEGLSGWWYAYDVLRPDGERYKICPPATVEQCRERSETCYSGTIAWCNRWIAHYDNRLAYERAMLAADGGLVAEQHPIGIGGQVLRRGQWFTVLKVNMRDGVLSSVTVAGHWKTTVSADEIQGYKPPTEGAFETARAIAKIPPLCNYLGDNFATITQAEWDNVPSDYKATGGRRGVIPANDKYVSHRVRVCLGVYAKLPPESEEDKHKPCYCSANRTHTYWHVFITDAKTKLPDKPNDGEIAPQWPSAVKETPEERAERYIKADKIRLEAGTESINSDTLEMQFKTQSDEPQTLDASVFDAMKETLKAGVQVVTAPQLFPTPPEVAKRLVELAELQDGVCVLEPSAGTGNIVQAIIDSVDTEIVGVEINQQLCSHLERTFPSFKLNVQRGDFLAMNGELGRFERIIMNPPFEHGSDVKHILHALDHLTDGGRLVAICANGPRQHEALESMADQWIDLEPGTFKEQGTNVNTAIVIIIK